MNHSDDFDADPVARELRASFERHAAEAPAGHFLADRIIAAADQSDAHRRAPRRWRTWMLPLVTAGAVAAAVVTAVGIASYHPHADKPPVPGTSGSVHVTPSPTAAPTHAPSHPISTPSSRPTSSGDLADVRVLDLTFAGQDDGWALASARCVGGPGRCTATLRTTDGRSWHRVTNPPANVDGVNGCADPCVEHLRFANDQVGYAFGPNVLFMTTDGAQTWHQQPGLGVMALETYSGNVIAVGTRRSPGPCANGCPTVLRSAIGSSTWTPVDVPGGNAGLASNEVTIARNSAVTLILVSRYDSAKGFDQAATLYRSTDEGATWHRRADPCPSVGDGYTNDAIGLTVGGDGAFVASCVTRQRSQTFLAGGVVISTDGGKSFTEPSSDGKLGPAIAVGAADANHRFVYAAVSGRPDEQRMALYASSGPAPWNDVSQISGAVTFVGFESTTVGRVVADGGRTIWTTRDAGAHWQPVTP